jgi:pimeloyl-ACP methyl ester carboxylesterase
MEVNPDSPHSTNQELHNLESGPENSPLVVLIHGSLDRSSGMARIARLTQTHHRTLRYDRRGYGASWMLPGPYTVENHVNDLVHLLRGREAVLVGHSYGGHMALGAAGQLGHQIIGVSTYETPLSWMPWWSQNTAGAMSLTASSADAAEKFMIRLVGKKIWETLPEKTREERRREGPALTGELGALREGVPWNIEQITCPVICGHGTLALEHHIRGAQWLAQNLPNATLSIIDGARHGAHTAQAQQFVDQLVMPHLVGSGTFTVTS